MFFRPRSQTYQNISIEEILIQENGGEAGQITIIADHRAWPEKGKEVDYYHQTLHS